MSDLDGAGLPAPSVIRTAKIATIQSTAATRLGRIPAPQRRQVARRLIRTLGGAECSGEGPAAASASA